MFFCRQKSALFVSFIPVSFIYFENSQIKGEIILLSRNSKARAGGRLTRLLWRHACFSSAGYNTPLDTLHRPSTSLCLRTTTTVPCFMECREGRSVQNISNTQVYYINKYIQQTVSIPYTGCSNILIMGEWSASASAKAEPSVSMLCIYLIVYHVCDRRFIIIMIGGDFFVV